MASRLFSRTDVVVVESVGAVTVVSGVVTVVEVEETTELVTGVAEEGGVALLDCEHAAKNKPEITTTAAVFETLHLPR